MSAINIFWLTLYGISTLLFFSVASFITYFGIQDMKDLLSKSNKRDNKGKSQPNSNSN
jgi:hypothetical protein